MASITFNSAYTDGDVDTNFSELRTLNEIADERFSRRQTLLGGLTASVSAFVLLPIAFVAFLLMMNSRAVLGDEMPTGARRWRWNIAMIASTGVMTIASLYVMTIELGAWGWIAIGAFLLAAIVAQEGEQHAGMLLPRDGVVVIDHGQRFEEVATRLGKTIVDVDESPPGMRQAMRQDRPQLARQVAREGIAHLDRRRQRLGAVLEDPGQVLARVPAAAEEQRDPVAIEQRHHARSVQTPT